MEKESLMNDYRRDLKEKILQQACEKFNKLGIKDVKMDDIAHSLSISKRTLYEIYPTKEDLLLESLNYHSGRSRQTMSECLDESSNVMDILYHLYHTQTLNLTAVSPLFIEDMKRYPRVMEYVQIQQLHNREQARKYFDRGVKEGFFVNRIDFDLLSELISYIHDSIMQKRLYFRYPLEKIFTHTLLMFIRSICTEKGIKEIDRIILLNYKEK